MGSLQEPHHRFRFAVSGLLLLIATPSALYLTPRFRRFVGSYGEREGFDSGELE